MSDETGLETQVVESAKIQKEVAPDKAAEALSEFDKTFEQMYDLYTGEQKGRQVPLPFQNIMNYVVDKSLLYLRKIYQKVFNEKQEAELQKKSEELILDFITNYNKHDVKEEAALALAKWIKDSTELQSLGILGKEQVSLLASAHEMFEVKIENGISKLSRRTDTPKKEEK